MVRRSVGTFLVLGFAARANAAALDLDLGRYTNVVQQGANYCPIAHPGDKCPVSTLFCDRPVCVVPDNQRFYSLASELGIVLAPPLLSPSETLGFSGFAIGATFGFTTVSTDASYWQAAESYEFANNDLTRGELPDSDAPPTIGTTVGATVRKGLWLPVPSFELGLGFRHLLQSGVFTVEAEAKVSLHEGFLSWPLPEIAVRGSGARAMGDTAFDLTIAGLDFSMSKQLGILGTVNLTPYFGYQLLWIVADPEVIDATPDVDPVQEQGIDQAVGSAVCDHPDCNANFVFFDPDPIRRQRIFFGFRLNFDPASLTGEYAYAFKGDSTDRYAYASGSGSSSFRNVEDEAAAQHTFALSVGLDF